MNTRALAPDSRPLAAAPVTSTRLCMGIACFASDAGRSGMGQYLVNVVHRLPLLAPEAEFVVFAPRKDAALWRDLPVGVTVELVADAFDRPMPSLLWHSTVLPSRLRAHGCNVVFLPAGNRRLGLGYGIPGVATVHDLSQLHVAGKYDRIHMFYAAHVLPVLIRRQAHIIAVSANTRSDVLAHARIRPELTSVVHNGCDLQRYLAHQAQPASARTAPAGLLEPYILYVARLEHPGKNHVTLLEAYARLRARGITHKLVLAGPRWEGAEPIFETVERLGLSKQVVFTGFVANDDLAALYAAADLFVFPSLYEGFGIPLLEAMASGTPCCVANTSSLPEVAGDAALLFDPRDSAAMAESMCRILTDDVLRTRLRARGLQRCKEFTWDRSAAGVLDACRAAVG